MKNLLQLIEDKFKSALTNGDISYTSTVPTKLVDPTNGLQYMVTYTPSLVSKPERRDMVKSVNKSDPLARDEPELTISTDFTGTGRYKLILNKFPVLPNHCMLVTKHFEHQKDDLVNEDVSVSWEILREISLSDHRFTIFYNCGPNSGSSQDHKHLQILPILPEQSPFQDNMQGKNIPFAQFTSSMAPEAFNDPYQIYLELLHQMRAEYPHADYNFIMTLEWMCIIPRTQTVASSLQLGFNATGYTGLIIVKQKAILDEIHEKPQLVGQVLAECGMPSK